jgi:signal transduction histidine kinase
MAEKHKSKYKKPENTKYKSRKDLKDYTIDDKDGKLNPYSTKEKLSNVLRKTDKTVQDDGNYDVKYNADDRLYKDLEDGEYDAKHAAKILRHDMHSGINTYMPRGLSSLDRRLTEAQAKELKIEAPLKMIKEGLRHTQKVYKGVYEFTNLVKKDVVLNKSACSLNAILEDYLSATAYRPQVILENLGECEVNEALFCTSIDNLIRNGLKYNDSATKFVKIYRTENDLFIEDNGRGLSAEDFKYLSQPYTRKEGQKESGTGLGLNICIAILEEHGFSITCGKLPEIGTQMKIKIK